MEKIILTNMCLIENKNDNTVVVIDRVNSWPGIAFPGGHIEEGEPIVPSVIREVKEETGLDIDNLIFCGVRDWYEEDINTRNIVFMFKTASFKGTLIEKTSEGKVSWRKLSDIKDEEYAEGLDKEMAIFFEKNVNEFYSAYDKEKKIWSLIKY